MKEVIKLLFALGMPLLCIWGANGCFKIMEEKAKEEE